jgi:hypothetical protein
MKFPNENDKDYNKKVTDYWNKLAQKLLLGRKITQVRYMTDKEVKDHYWTYSPVCIQLDNEVWMYPSMDDEGNEAGALFTTDNKTVCLPVMR